MIEAARAAHIHDFIETLPAKYETHGGRARPEALRRREAARGDRARDAEEPRDPDLRRGDLGARFQVGEGDPGRARAHLASAAPRWSSRTGCRRSWMPTRSWCWTTAASSSAARHRELLAAGGEYARMWALQQAGRRRPRRCWNRPRRLDTGVEVSSSRPLFLLAFLHFLRLHSRRLQDAPGPCTNTERSLHHLEKIVALGALAAVLALAIGFAQAARSGKRAPKLRRHDEVFLRSAVALVQDADERRDADRQEPAARCCRSPRSPS